MADDSDLPSPAGPGPVGSASDPELAASKQDDRAPLKMMKKKGSNRQQQQEQQEPFMINIMGPNITHLSNSVTTSKYTSWNFVPKNLMEQFRRIANIYFLIISILQVSTDLSPTNKYATLFPLTIVLTVTMIKEILEDIRRHQDDARINASLSLTLRDGEFVPVPWSEIVAGDVVKVLNKQQVPADLLMFAASGQSGACYINTANLDGEDNLKLRQCLPDLLQYDEAAKMNDLAGTTVECEWPNADLYAFKGNITVATSGESFASDINNVVWRGSSVENTDWVCGFVVYTGHDSKLIRNSRQAPAKRSNVERQVDRGIMLIFVVLAVMCSVSTFFHALLVDRMEVNGAWYLPFTFSDAEKLKVWLTFLILYNNLVPISLYVSLEVVKLVQAKLINADAAMYQAETNLPAMSRTSNLNEDLGQIEYVFSDKTGTLTCNEMEFKLCTVAGRMYGSLHEDEEDTVDVDEPGTYRAMTHHQEQEDQRADVAAAAAADDEEKKSNAAAAAAGGDDEENALLRRKNEREQQQERPTLERRRSKRIPKRPGMAGYNFDDRTFLVDLHSNLPQAANIKAFLTALAVCHTVIPERDDDTHNLLYKASSPDEGALVSAARQLGFEFHTRGHKYIQVRQNGVDQRIDILNVNEFSSTRKRMSVVAKAPGGTITLWCKGADDVMLARLASTDAEMAELRNQLYEFATVGLRTLVIGSVELDPHAYQAWNKRYYDATMDVDRRDERLAALAEELEQGMRYVGATAIEDKLQVGVPRTIEKLTQAGIKVWMLTGDKLETAQNIAFSCHLLNESLDLVRVNESTKEKTEFRVARALKQYSAYLGGNCETLAVLVTGHSLGHVLGNDDMRLMFLELIKMAKVVVACRVIPAQKAEIVRMVRNGIKPTPLTLAIGDGANDVAMIQEAHVGIGLAGNEGMQAVRSSDYAIAQFRFLSRLLLVHGHWNYRRVCLLILYSFYKNITNVLTLFYYGSQNAWSGTTLYESWLGAGWNVGWTLFPVLAFGIFEQDLSSEVLMQNPHAYIHGQRHQEFNLWKMVLWIVNSVIHSAVVYGLAIGSFQTSGGQISDDGVDTGLFLMGTMINACTVLTVNYKICLETRFWTRWNKLAVAGSVLIWMLFVFVYQFLIEVSWDFYGVAWQLYRRPHWYLLVLLVPTAAVIWDVVYSHVQRTYWPSPLDILQELQSIGLAKQRAGLKVNWNFAEAARTGDISGVMTPSSKPTTDTVVTQKLRHLNEILSSNTDEAPAGSRNFVDERRRNYSKDVNMHPITLVFSHFRKLEARFQRAYVDKSVVFVRRVMLVMFVLIALYTCYSGLVDEGLLEYRVAGTVTAGILLAVLYTRVFLLYFHEIIIIVLFVGGIFRTLLVTSNGTIGLGLYAISAFLILRARFFHAAIVVSIDFVFYNVYTATARNIFTTVDLLRVDFLHLCLVMFCGYVAYEQERAYRRDFLLQEDFEREKERTQDIIDNIMPRYITKQIRAMAGSSAKALTQVHLVTHPSNTSAYNNNNNNNNSGGGGGGGGGASGDGGVGGSGDDGGGTKRGESKRGESIELKGWDVHNRDLIANDEGEVTVLFCDIAGFQELLSSNSPVRLVGIMDGVYSTFDELCVKHGVQKMETVGKTYMACAGLTGTRKDHAMACVELATDMMRSMAQLHDRVSNPIRIRIGINTGGCISGVVGLKRPQFSLFGDTVNTASRMDSTGDTGQIQLTEATAAYVRRDYTFIPRTVEAKGKGKMNTFLVERRQTKQLGSRQWDLVELKYDDDVIKESRALVRAASMVHVKDDPTVEVDSPTRILRNMRFLDADVESDFMYEYRKTSGHRSRYPLYTVAVYFFFEALFEYIDLSDKSQENVTTVFVVRYVLFVIGCVQIIATWTPFYERHAAMCNWIYFTACQVGSLSIPLVTDNTIDTRAALGFIFMNTLLTNSGTIRFVRNIAQMLLSGIIWVVASYYFADSTKERSTNRESNLRGELLFFVLAGSCINLIAAYAREYYHRREFVLTRQVLVEKEKSDTLLFDMLPAPVAMEIREGASAIADEFEGVSILYSDIKNFTKYSSSAKPKDVIFLLNKLFSEFDRATNRLAVYKVQTIGDAYVCVAGLPFVQILKDDNTEDLSEEAATPAAHASRLTLFAMEMHDNIAATKTVEGTYVQMRIGIHTGKILAGVIGTKQLRYDIWGPDTLIANTLESEGVPGGILVSKKAQWFLEPKYKLIPHKDIHVKGQMDLVSTFLVHYPLNHSTRRYAIADAVEQKSIQV